MDIDCNSLSTAVWIYDIDEYCILWTNPAGLALWEAQSLAELCSRDFKKDSSEAVQETLLNYREDFLEGKKHSMFWQFTPNNIQKEVFCQMSGHRLQDGRIALKCEAVNAQLINKNVAEQSSIMLSTFDVNGEFISANPLFLEKMGNAIKHINQLYCSDSDDITKRILEEKSSTDDCLIDTKEGPIWYNLHASLSNEKLGKREILVQQFNINERKLEQLYLKKQADTDPLTGLLNRRGLQQSLEAAIDQDSEYYIYYIDLDKFKKVNDTMGHAVGDIILKSLAKRLQQSFDEKSIASRLGGDEFILMVDKKNSRLSQSEIANQLLKATNLPYKDADGHPIHVSASVGSAMYPRDGRDINKLILRADAAMYMAKSQGRKREISYSSGMEDSLQRSRQVARYLYLAMQNNELQLHYQPVIDTKINRIYSFEALLRWNNSILGLVPTREAIQVAKSIGVIGELDNWVIKQAITDLPKLRAYTQDATPLSINISGLHFLDSDLTDQLVKSLKQADLHAQDLIIEITEDTLLQAIKSGHQQINKLLSSGIHLAVDDFGTGTSSLAFLDRISNCSVKIDKNFTARLEQTSATLIGMQALLRSLNITTILKGVETPFQSSHLKSIDLNLQQGFNLGHPKALSDYLPRVEQLGNF